MLRILFIFTKKKTFGTSFKRKKNRGFAVSEFMKMCREHFVSVWQCLALGFGQS